MVWYDRFLGRKEEDIYEKLNPVQQYFGTESQSSREHTQSYEKYYETLEIVNRAVNMVVDDCAEIPAIIQPIGMSGVVKGIKRSKVQKLINEDSRVKKLTELSLKLEGLNRNVATHAAGVVIADKKLSDLVPLYKDASANLLLPSTQFDMYSAENAGLIKFDFLGLKTLTVISNTQKLIRKKNKNFDIEDINFEDQKVFDLLSSGKTVGLFQIESAGMREALIQMKPNHIEDIIALVALYLSLIHI